MYKIPACPAAYTASGLVVPLLISVVQCKKKNLKYSTKPINLHLIRLRFCPEIFIDIHLLCCKDKGGGTYHIK